MVCKSNYTFDSARLLLQTHHAVFEITVELPAHLKRDKLSVKLIGQACSPEVEIVEPTGVRQEELILNFGRTLVNDCNGKKLAFANVGVITAQVILEIHEDPNAVFALGACKSTRLLSTDCEYEAEGEFTSPYQSFNGIIKRRKNIE